MRQISRAAAFGLALVLLSVPGAGAKEPATEAGNPPNIVVIYLDDVAPHDGRLWSDPNLTPTLARTFVQKGIHFPNAIVENPLCCPARGNLLTGLHTHNNNLVSNHARKFDPSVHVGQALRNQGYATMFLGKYMNRTDVLTSSEWTAHAAGWTHFDVIKGVNGKFYNYTLFTKNGDLSFGSYHSTRMVAERFVLRSRQVAASKPILAVLSIYNLHSPHTPLEQFASDPRCSSMPPWKPPNYNEADMSDKPLFQQSRPLLPYADGWPMVRNCREMLGVDWAVKQVIDELKAQGRLDNTLLVFTADNGMSWGAHRKGESKRHPHTTPVPLYLSWPARWGSSGRVIEEHTSNIDLAPTFCAAAGCSIGPFFTGKAGPDGVDLLPLIDGQVSHLGRDALLEIHNDPGRKRSWTALRTTARHPAGLWHYIEWSTGERELYNLEADPWQLENVYGKAATSSVANTLAQRLAELRLAGRVPHLPDAKIALNASGSYKGNNIYWSQPLPAQTRQRTGARLGSTYSFFVRVQNDGTRRDSLRLKGSESGSSSMTVRYFAGSTEITSQIVAGSYTTASLRGGEQARIEVRVRVGSSTPSGAVKRVLVRAASVADPARVDLVRAEVRR